MVELPEDRHWWFATRTWELLGLLDVYVRRREGEVLDIGCGAGNMIHHLQRYGRVLGIELDPRPVAMARARGYDVRQGDATRGLPLADAQFDLVTVLDVIEHVDDDAAILREAQRVLKPSGILAITVPAFQWLWSHNDVLNGHRRRYTSAELGHKVSGVGLRIRRLTYGFSLVFPLSAPLILVRHSLGKRPELSSHHFERDAYQVEMEPVSPWLNRTLRGVGRIEASLVKRINLPIGTSLLCIAQKS